MNSTTILVVTLALLVGGIIGHRFGTRAPRLVTAPQVDEPAAGMATARTEATTLAMFDVDDLGSLNRTHDFDTGDRLLDAVADVLGRGMPSGASLERLDSGRILIWLPDIGIEATARLIDELRILACNVQIEGTDGPVARTLTAGVVATVPDERPARAILRADVAISDAKYAGGNRTQTLRSRVAPSLITAREVIEDAIATRALEYYVQPILALADRRPVGVENLLRWNRPDGSVVGPAGFIETLDRLPSAAADLLPSVASEAAGPFVTGPDPIYATFNITGAVLDGEESAAFRWLDHVLEILPNDRVVLELIETAIIVEPVRARRLLDNLRSRGLRIALDDFGAGLSNLERLRRYPVDILKLDRAFVGGLGGSGREEAILSAMVALANGLDLDLIAEGIETEAQVDVLTGLGVKYGQGYHLGRPAPASDWATRLNRGT